MFCKIYYCELYFLVGVMHKEVARDLNSYTMRVGTLLGVTTAR